MRFVGQKVTLKMLAFELGLLLLVAGFFSTADGQTAPYVLPYTMSTYAGPVTSSTIGANCGSYIAAGATLTTVNYVALDTVGDGCKAPNFSIGSDPHDIRVDARGNIYWADNSSKDIIHKIDGETGLETVYIGSVAQSSVCGSGDKFGGDGCVATDGAANSSSTTHYTAGLKTNRGIGVAPNGDFFLSSYSSSIVSKVPVTPGTASPAAATGIMIAVAGDGTSGYYDSAQSTSLVSTPRGVGVDPNTGVVYIADTGNDMIRKSTLVNGVWTVSDVTAQGGAAVSGSAGCSVAPYSKNISNGPASSAMVCAPEDVQVDLNGNVFIADAGNNVVRAIYNGTGTLPGITSPQKGYIYLIAGYNALNTAVAANTYPTDGTTPTFPATTITMSIRKISLDALGNLYIADANSTANSVWFVDHATGNVRILAGSYGLTAPASGATAATRTCTTPYVQTDVVGDGCPGPDAGIFYSASSNPAASPDFQGNLYISDAEGTSQAGLSRIRKLLSGLNFPATNLGSTSIQQTIFIHFAPNDTAAASTPFTTSNPDFTIGAPKCPAANTDTTSDCYVPVTFRPSVPGNDTATLTIKSSMGGVNTYLLTGTGTAPAIAIDPGSAAVLTATTGTKNPQGIALDGVGNAYIADTGNNRVLFYNVGTGTTTIFAGTGASGYSGDNGLATAAFLNGPKAVTISTDGSVYIADSGNNVIRKVNAAGVITTYAGGATAVCSQAVNTRGDSCPGTQATFSNPSGIVADNLGQIYVSDTGNNVIRQINDLGWVSTLAGGGTACAAYTYGTVAVTPSTFGDGCSALATTFNAPTGLAFDPKGPFLIVADTGDNEVRKISLGNQFGYSGTGTSTTAGTILLNEVVLVAGDDGQAGSSIGANNAAIATQLNAPTAVAVDAAENIYVADAQNAAIRFVNSTASVPVASGKVTLASGVISTVAGINGAPGTGTVPGPAISAQLNAPMGVAVTPNGTLYIADTGNNRILTDVRSQVTFNFGRVNLGSSSSAQVFTESNIGTSVTALSAGPSTAFYTASGGTGAAVFTLTSPSSGGCTNGESLAPGASCTLQGQFTPTTIGNYTESYTETAVTSTGPTPSITLVGVGAVLTPTTSTVTQTLPATGNSQYGGSVTLSATVTAACNTAAPSCYPTGTVRIVVDGTAGSPITLSSTATGSQTIGGLAVGPHTISCQYSGDNFYAASNCANVTITVAQASTTSLLASSQNNQPQATPVTFTATVLSNTSGIPTGTVTFYANGTAIGTASLGGVTTATASLTLSQALDLNGYVTNDTTLPPGTYAMTCTYDGAANFAVSNCPATSFTVTPQVVAFTLTAIACPAADLYLPGTSIAGKTASCSSGSEYFPTAAGAVPTVATAQGSTADATIFIQASNTVSGALTFSCSGLPAASTCTFSPTSITFVPSAAFANPVYTDVTFWTDLQPGFITSEVHAPSIGNGKTSRVYAAMFGWPMTLIGLAALVGFRRKQVRRGIALLGLLLVMLGSSLVMTGCAGPGAYQPVLTPAGTYPITITVKGAGVTQSTVVNFIVAAPGITGQE
jgi:sugar lactone lactonase YvrE